MLYVALIEEKQELLSEMNIRKLSEEELQQLSMELDRRVLHRSVELEKAIKELDAFAYFVSHDLHAPLGHIDGLRELLQKSAGMALDELSLHYMHTISNVAK